MAARGTTTDAVLAAARSELQAQLGVVREELSQLAAEERALTQALSSLGGRTPSSSRATARTQASTPTRRGSARRSSRRRRKRGASKPTAERVKELEALLRDGPKSRNDLAAALQVSPPRVQQLLAELGNSVSSQPDPTRGQVKLWSLNGGKGRSARA